MGLFAHRENENSVVIWMSKVACLLVKYGEEEEEEETLQSWPQNECSYSLIYSCFCLFSSYKSLLRMHLSTIYNSNNIITYIVRNFWKQYNVHLEQRSVTDAGTHWSCTFCAIFFNYLSQCWTEAWHGFYKLKPTPRRGPTSVVRSFTFA